MGFCFNNQLRMVHVTRDSIKHNKNRQIKRPRLIRNPSIKSRRRQLPQLSAEDYSFLQSIGLSVRKNGRQL